MKRRIVLRGFIWLCRQRNLPSRCMRRCMSDDTVLEQDERLAWKLLSVEVFGCVK